MVKGKTANGKVIKSICLGCISSCGVLYHVEDNRIVKVEGDPEHPLTRGYVCPRGIAAEEVRSHPERLLHPLKRVGERGAGKWKQISWDEAIDETATRLAETRQKYGAEAVVGSVGFNGIIAGLDPDVGKFLHEFGSPNRLPTLYICEMPAHIAGIYTCGFSLVAGIDFRNSKSIVIWGFDADISWRGLYRADIMEARKNGAKLIVIDPRPTPMSKEADLWLRIRPGTDCALALGMINVIINEGLYDKDFVDKWAIGFVNLKNHVQWRYTPERVAEITWVPAELIREAARMYARNKPACIGQGGGGLCHNTNSFQTNRAISLLPAITGNIDIPGSHIAFTPLLRAKGTMAAQYDRSVGKLSKEQIDKRLGNNFLIIKRDGYMIAHDTGVWPAIIEGKPYPVKAMLSIASNLLASAEDTNKVRKALMALDFFAISDLFMSPACQLADIVFPAVHFTERDEVVDAYSMNYIFPHPRAVDPPEECREDKQILIDLARKLGMNEYWKSVDESLNSRMEALKMSFKDFLEKGMIFEPIEYSKHEEFGRFRTGSGKIDLYSATLASMGTDPIPVHKEPPESPVSTPELAKEYPLILITGSKVHAFFHSMYRNVPSLHKITPEPLLDINPDTAKKLGIKDGDWVQIETKRGSIKHKARFDKGLDPRVVSAPHGWWYGYKDGWKEVNVNILTDSEHYDPCVGSAQLKGLLCRVRKAESAPVLS